jgi:hypothetical protein
VLTGEFDDPEELADVGGVMREIEAARLDEERAGDPCGGRCAQRQVRRTTAATVDAVSA